MISLVGIAGMKTYDYESHHDFAAVPRAACVYGSSLKAAPLPVGDRAITRAGIDCFYDANKLNHNLARSFLWRNLCLKLAGYCL